MLLALVTGAGLRLWQVGLWPPGLYRDEAYNGLDALGVLQGDHALFFAANNGREPAYIYLTALAVALFGRTVFAVRLAAALAGTLTTLFTFLLARNWFGVRCGLLAAWLWAVTLWPVHLSRLGLRPILLVPALALAFWLGTLAYRHNRRWLWLAAGAAYGISFYTYLAARFTPLLLAALLSYLFLNRPERRAALLRGLLWGGAGTGLTLLPLALLALQQPDLVLGRTGQVSLLNETVNRGDLPGTLLRQIGQGLALFLWKGDTIARHNPPGRPLFDLVMVLPFLAGLFWALRHWRRPAAAALLLWVTIMLGPTILAEDTPHFLRAVGIMPAALLLPALGLSNLWDWPKLAGALRHGLVMLLAGSTLIVTITDYSRYVQEPETAYLFEAAALDLAQDVARDSASQGMSVHVDRRFWEGWPSIRFLLKQEQLRLFAAQDGLAPEPGKLLSIYAWPHGTLDFIPQAVAATEPALVFAQRGALARGDLEPEAYPLYVRYLLAAEPPASVPGMLARFGNGVWLREATVTVPQPRQLQVDLLWEGNPPAQVSPVVFVHVVESGHLVGQDDAPPLQGYWSPAWWQPGLLLHDRHLVALDSAFDPGRQQLVVGLYDANTLARLPVYDPTGVPAGDSWQLEVHKEK